MASEVHFREVLAGILKPRVVGTQGHDEVNAFIKQNIPASWTVMTDRFDEATPLGVKTFENVVAYSSPNAVNYLVLAAHYDSKFFVDGDFIGATDSAVPCAMLLNLVRTLEEPLKVLQQDPNRVGLMLIFFDGEEAFQSWNAKDSLYGARHLAQRWQDEVFLPRIKLFVLLDLLGTPQPSFYNYFPATADQYEALYKAESRLRKDNYMPTPETGGMVRNPGMFFKPNTVQMGIEDDHIPFLRRGVPIVHLIPTPFPEVWHEKSDNGDCIDYDTVSNLNHIMRLYAVEYLNLPVTS